MNGKDIFLGLRYVDEDIIEEAEYGTFSTKADASVQEKKRRSIRRPLLIAAVIALAAVLVGCAVVYALRMQDMSIGTETYTQSFDDSGKAIEPVEKTRDILTLYGHSGDAIQSAMKEWYEFTESYDPDGKLMDNNPDHPEIPNYLEWTYSCYTLEMADKLQEIADKYNLKLLEEWIPFQQYQSDIFLEESGIGSLTRPDSGAETSRMAGMFYPPNNFQMEFDLSFDALDHKVSCTALYARKDYFPREFPGGVDLSLFDQWDYTAADGTKLLLALSNKGTAYIIAQPENAMLIYSIDGNFSGSGYPTAEEILTKEELEQIADVFDYSIQPHEVDRAAVQAKLDEAQAEYDAEHTFEPETYGNFSEALKKRVTLPNEKAQYAFYDVTGDGIEDLLIDSAGYGAITEWFTSQDGEVKTDFGISTYLCEGRVLETHYPASESNGYVYHGYQKAVSDTALMDMDPETEGEWIADLLFTDGKWTYAPNPNTLERQEITQAEAQSIMTQYPHISLVWSPLMDYPLSETQTMRDYLNEKDVRLSNEELRQIYKEYLSNRNDVPYSYYRILDINGDGVEDLLLKSANDPLAGKGDFYSVAFTYRYGRITRLAMSFSLCEDNVIEYVETRHGDTGVEINGHEFVRLKDFQQETTGFAAYNKATATWQSDWNGTPMTEEEANAVLNQYPRIDQGMRPISELLD